MDTETLVKTKVKAVEDALRKDNHNILLVVAPLDEGWGSGFVIHAKPLQNYDSYYEVVRIITEKLFLLTDADLRLHISHIQVHNRLSEPSRISPATDRIFAQRELAALETA